MPHESVVNEETTSKKSGKSKKVNNKQKGKHNCQNQNKSAKELAFDISVGSYNRDTGAFDNSQLLDSTLKKLISDTDVISSYSCLKKKTICDRYKKELDLFDALYKNLLSGTSSEESSSLSQTIIDQVTNSNDKNAVKIEGFLGSHKNRFLQNLYLHILHTSKFFIPIYIDCAQYEYQSEEFCEKTIKQIKTLLLKPLGRNEKFLFIVDSIRNLTNNKNLKEFYNGLNTAWETTLNSDKFVRIVSIDNLEIRRNRNLPAFTTVDYEKTITINRLAVKNENDIKDFQTNSNSLFQLERPGNRQYDLFSICKALNLNYIDLYLTKIIYKSVDDEEWQPDNFYMSLCADISIDTESNTSISSQVLPGLMYNFYYKNDSDSYSIINTYINQANFRKIFDHELIIIDFATRYYFSRLTDAANNFMGTASLLDGNLQNCELPDGFKRHLQNLSAENNNEQFSLEPLNKVYKTLKNLMKNLNQTLNEN